MISYVIPLLSSFLVTDFVELWLFPVFAGYFIASVPSLIRMFFKWR